MMISVVFAWYLKEKFFFMLYDFDGGKSITRAISTFLEMALAGP
jgi:hypothetical protein